MLTFTSSSKPVTRHVKLLLYGGPGTGKTYLALHAPTPLVIDTESSTDAYRGRSDIPEFWVAKSAQPSEILETLEHLAQRGSIGGITPQTLVVDSFSVLWQVRQEAGQKKAERHAKNPDQARVSYYDWAWIKRPIQRLYTQLVNMPFNIILTAREKAVYDEIKDGSQTKLEIVDYVPDIERNAEYVFDLVLRLSPRTWKRLPKPKRPPSLPPGRKTPPTSPAPKPSCATTTCPTPTPTLHWGLATGAKHTCLLTSSKTRSWPTSMRRSTGRRPRRLPSNPPPQRRKHSSPPRALRPLSRPSSRPIPAHRPTWPPSPDSCYLPPGAHPRPRRRNTLLGYLDDLEQFIDAVENGDPIGHASPLSRRGLLGRSPAPTSHGS